MFSYSCINNGYMSCKLIDSFINIYSFGPMFKIKFWQQKKTYLIFTGRIWLVVQFWIWLIYTLYISNYVKIWYIVYVYNKIWKFLFLDCDRMKNLEEINGWFLTHFDYIIMLINHCIVSVCLIWALIYVLVCKLYRFVYYFIIRPYITNFTVMIIK